MQRFFVLFYEVVENYVERRQPFRQLHLEHAHASAAKGGLIMGGALADPVDQAILIFQGESPEVAIAFANNDPYVLNQLVSRWYVREWTPVAGSLMPQFATAGR